MDSKLNIALIGRSGCYLCDEASDALARVLGRFAAEYPQAEFVVENLDIDGEPKLLEKYADEIPVLLLNGSQQSFWRIDEERLFAALERTQK